MGKIIERVRQREARRLQREMNAAALAVAEWRAAEDLRRLAAARLAREQHERTRRAVAAPVPRAPWWAFWRYG